MIHLPKQQAAELGEVGIRANCVCSGPVDTKLAMAVHSPENTRSLSRRDPPQPLRFRARNRVRYMLSRKRPCELWDRAGGCLLRQVRRYERRPACVERLTGDAWAHYEECTFLISLPRPPFAVLFPLPQCSSRTSTTTCVSAMTLLCQSNKSARRYHRQTISRRRCAPICENNVSALAISPSSRGSNQSVASPRISAIALLRA